MLRKLIHLGNKFLYGLHVYHGGHHALKGGMQLFGMVSYVILNTITGKVKKISITMWVLFVIFLLKFFIK